MNSLLISKNNENRQVKIVFHKLVDKDIQSMLRPLNIVQTVCFCPKYRIKNNIIFPTSRLSNIMSIFGTVMFIFVFLSRIIFFHLTERIIEHNNMKFIYFVSYCDFFF